MKTITTLLFFVALCVSSAFGQTANVDTVTFAWNPSPSPAIQRYSLYFSQSTNAWTHVKNAGSELQATVGLPTLGRWYFIATATDTNGLESVPSNMVYYDVLPGPAGPAGMRILSAIVTRISTIVKAPTMIEAP